MTSNNKILTVSYGTFSCTLEGFEDSFETMKTIAEYFRDLAQEDRYFGAEPPQPDANVLARIAEKEIARHVDAAADENGIHLRAAMPAIAAATAVAAEAAAEEDEAPEAEMAEVETPEVEEIIVEDLVAVDDPADEMVAGEDPEPEIVEEDVAEVEAVEEVVAEDLVNDFVAADEEDIVEADASHEDDTDQMLAVLTAQDDTGTIDEPGDLAALTDEPIAGLAELVEAKAEVAEADAPVVETSIASRLQAIRAVVAKSDDETDGYSEDQHAEDMPEEDEPAMASFEEDEFQDDQAEVAEIDEDIEGVAAIEDIAEIEEDGDTDATIASALANFGAESDEDIVAEAEDAPVAEESADEASEEDELAAILNDVDAFDTLVLDEETAEVAEEDEADAPLDLAAFGEALETEADETEASDDEMVEIDADDLSELESVLNLDDIDLVEAEADEATSENGAPGRVLMVKKSDLEAALENGMLEEVDEDEADAEDIDLGDVEDLSGFINDLEDDRPDAVAEDDPSEEETAFETSLSDEDEADLMRELEAVESELDNAVEAVADETLDDDEDATDSAAERLQEVTGAQEDELDRLMAEADNQMEEPEGKDRRSAFGHLRGAVVATKSDDKLSEVAAGVVENEDDYRTDLAAAVRPRRPVSSGGGERPQSQRPAPLKLVAEQRIDEIADGGPSEPVRPRRVEASEMPKADSDASSFSDYAQAQGARELSDLLEAAASYLSFVEGRDQFSRPQLMTKVRQVGHEEFTREAGLRSFGQLLRSGKIEKIKGGRFTVSQDIGFQPEERQAG